MRCFGFGFGVGVVGVAVVVVDGAGSGGGVTTGGGGSVGCGSGALTVGAVDAGGSFGLFFLQADENITVAANSKIAAVRTAFIACCSDPVRIRIYSIPRRGHLLSNLIPVASIPSVEALIGT